MTMSSSNSEIGYDLDVPSLDPRPAPIVFFERAKAVRGRDGDVVILLMLDIQTMEPGYLLEDIAPCGWLRFSDNGLLRLHAAVEWALYLRGLALD